LDTASNLDAKQILESFRAELVRTQLQHDAFDWAYWPTLEMAEDEDNAEDITKQGLREWLRTDMIYRLGEQLQQMVVDQIGQPTYRKDLALARVAKTMAEKLETM
jgi:hypothetical protein